MTAPRNETPSQAQPTGNLRTMDRLYSMRALCPEAEARRLDRQAHSGAEKPETKPRPEMSGPMAEYMNLHRHSIARAALIKSVINIGF